MKKEPAIGHFVDDEEKEIVEAVESADFHPVSVLTPDLRAQYEAAAHATMNERRVKISLRLPESDLLRLKARALREGMPYQTLINSILHKAVS